MIKSIIEKATTTRYCVLCDRFRSTTCFDSIDVHLAAPSPPVTWKCSSPRRLRLDMEDPVDAVGSIVVLRVPCGPHWPCSLVLSQPPRVVSYDLPGLLVGPPCPRGDGLPLDTRRPPPPPSSPQPD